MFYVKNWEKSLFSFLIGLLVCLGVCSSVFGNALYPHAASAQEQSLLDESRRVVGYLPDWSYQSYSKIDFTALTHINLAFCNVSNGKLSCGIPDADLKAIVKKAHDNHVKVLAALGGAGYSSPYRDLIASDEKIESLNETITAFCEQYDLDGVDLDIEIDSSDSIWKNYGTWIPKLRTICDERDWVLSTATAQWVAGSTSSETFNLFDYLNVMAYDSDSGDSHSSYSFAVECLDYFHTKKNVPKEKLVLGVPFYGRGYSVNGSLDWDSYVSFGDLIKQDEANYDSDNYNGVAYTGASTMREKCALAKDYGGIMIWEITLDAEGEYSLLEVIKEEILSPLPVTVPDPATDPARPNDLTALWIVLAVVLTVGIIALVSVFAIRKKKGK